MNRSIAIVSGKGGVGKTTVTVNLCAALMRLRKNAIAIDADVKMSGLGLQLGMYYFPVTLIDVLMDKATISQSLYIHHSGIRVIPASLYTECVKMSKLRQVLNDSFFHDNIVLIDAPPGLESNVMAVLRACKEAIIVTVQEIPAVADVMKTMVAIRKTSISPIGIVVNKYNKDSEQVSVREIEDVCGLPVIGVVPEDKIIKKSIFRRIPSVFLNPYSPSSVAFHKIASHLIGEKYSKPKLAFIKRFLRGLKR